MQCPDCTSNLKLYADIKSESKDRVATTTHQWWKCRKCGLYFYAELIEYVFDESLTHYGYRAEKDIWKSDLRIIKKCRKHKDPLCGCSVHNTLNEISSHYTESVWNTYSS